MAFSILRKQLLLILLALAVTVVDVAANPDPIGADLFANLSKTTEYGKWCGQNCGNASTDSMLRECYDLGRAMKNFTKLPGRGPNAPEQFFAPDFCNNTLYHPTSNDNITTNLPIQTTTDSPMSTSANPTNTGDSTTTVTVKPIYVGSYPTDSSTPSTENATTPAEDATTPAENATTPGNTTTSAGDTSTQKTPADTSNWVLYYVVIPVVLLIVIAMLIGGMYIHRYTKKVGYRHSTKTNGEAAKGNVESP